MHLIPPSCIIIGMVHKILSRFVLRLRPKRFIFINHFGYLALITCFLATGCGGINLGGSGGAASGNAERPTGRVVAQGQIFGQSGKTASGSALIIYSSGSYVLRFEGLSIPSEAGLQAQINSKTVGQVAT